MTLNELKKIADESEKAFDLACKPHYCDGRWGFYRAIECNQPVPQSVQEAFDISHKALHDFYKARDGKDGFLGSRGL